RGSLADQADYRQINDELNKLGLKETSFRMFSRPLHAMRASYELVRADRADEAQTPLACTLRRWLGAPRLKPDVTLLPEFERIQDRLTPIGAVAVTVPDGWVVTALAVKAVPVARRSPDRRP